MSRLDYILASSNCLDKISSLKIYNIMISDHSPVGVSLDLATRIGNNYVWCFPSSLLRDKIFSESLKE